MCSQSWEFVIQFIIVDVLILFCMHNKSSWWHTYQSYTKKGDMISLNYELSKIEALRTGRLIIEALHYLLFWFSWIKKIHQLLFEDQHHPVWFAWFAWFHREHPRELAKFSIPYADDFVVLFLSLKIRKFGSYKLDSIVFDEEEQEEESQKNSWIQWFRWKTRPPMRGWLQTQLMVNHT